MINDPSELRELVNTLVPDKDQTIADLQKQLREARNQHFDLAYAVLKFAVELEAQQCVKLTAIVGNSLKPEQEK